ncbi:hypothetical protein DUNSADRAFT_1402 [Dunaliella salina]|uniref:Uncharacterized protein n=1 Tax=Dunaliella salina TaxID=3046 RepID=A0ABQ7GX41_DUNSA|nr:hypothetical protein DUNSADRAFT_1402 [Dunaliella salina]|eukprot:KAF5839175.1 hypothetical protein DUNSADRAFT_1402 [Dunaliella salina]
MIQAESASEGVRALTQSTGKRVDEHAAAIQRLTLAVNSHMDERPTSSMVRHMIEASTLENGEKLGSALLPVWDAVKALQAGLRDSINEARNAAGQALVLQQHQEELRLRVAGEKGAMAALASRAVADEVLPLLLAPSTGLGARMEAAEADIRSARVQLEASTEMHDKQSSRSANLEDQVKACAGCV